MVYSILGYITKTNASSALAAMIFFKATLLSKSPALVKCDYLSRGAKRRGKRECEGKETLSWASTIIVRWIFFGTDTTLSLLSIAPRENAVVSPWESSSPVSDIISRWPFSLSRAVTRLINVEKWLCIRKILDFRRRKLALDLDIPQKRQPIPPPSFWYSRESYSTPSLVRFNENNSTCRTRRMRDSFRILTASKLL